MTQFDCSIEVRVGQGGLLFYGGELGVGGKKHSWVAVFFLKAQEH